MPEKDIIALILLFRDKEKIDKSKFVSLTEIGHSDRSPNPGWIYTARITRENFEHIKNDPNIGYEESKPVYPV